MKKAGKPAKDTGTCPICWGEFKVQKDGTLHKHDHGGLNGGPCQESYKPPSSTKSAASATATTSQRLEMGDNSREYQSTPANQPSDDVKNEPSAKLHPPTWTPLITGVAKASRATCAWVLLNILLRII